MLSLNKKYIKGVTLLETLIYVAIFAVVAGGLIGILSGTIDVVSKEDAINEVDENLRQAISIMGDRIRSADIIQSATSTTLVLKMATTSPGGFSTTTFSVSNEMLYLTEGDNDPIAVISDKVKVDSLEFTKISMPGAKGGVRINMSLIYNSDKASLSFSKSILSTINRAVAITFNEDVLPGVDNSYNIGSSGNFRWRDGYFSGGLSIDGGVTSSQFCLSDGCQTSWADLGLWTANGDDIYYNTGNVGIGTTTPLYALHIVGDSPAIVSNYTGNSGGSYINTSDTYGFMGTFGGAYPLRIVYNNNWRMELDDIITIRDGYDFQVDTDALYVDASGNKVGVGTISPKAKLDVTSGSTFPIGFSANNNGATSTSIFGGYIGYNSQGGGGGIDIIDSWDDAGRLNVLRVMKLDGGSFTRLLLVDNDGNVNLTGAIIPDNACGISGSALVFMESVVDGNSVVLPSMPGQGAGMVCSGKITAISTTCNTADASNYTSFEGRINGVAQSCDTNDVKIANNTYSTTGCNVSFLANDIVGCYSKTKIGTGVKDCVCTLFVRFD